MGRRLPRIAALFSLLMAALLLSGCGYFNSPQNIFAPHGQVAQDQKDLFFLTMWPALAVMILVEAGLLFILIRFRRRKGDTGLPTQTHGNNKLEVGWTLAPMILLAFFIAPTIGGIVDLGRTPAGSLEVVVTGQRFSWSFTYQDPKGGPPIVQPVGEMHIPIDRTIGLQLKSIDVIHSFWVPKLAGKTDVIPGRSNHMWLKGTDIGTYQGQCAEFCGLDHAKMRFSVVVESQADFDAWLQDLKAQARQNGDDSTALAVYGE